MEILADRYVLEERLGSGGTATVWRATDKSLGVQRAVKVLDVAPGPDREALRERLRAEARAMAQVAHPNVVAVHDVGACGDRDFIVMELIDGPSLADHLDAEGPMHPEEAVRVAVTVLQALGAAHERGLVHRDVKPGNILLSSDGDAHLCDFGIALAEATEIRHTKTGAALGSLPYMAPEQRRDARSVGPEADLYAVGCTLYNALTCATPVDLYLAPGRSPRWAAVPDKLVEVLRTATAAEPTDRYADAAAMSRALLRATQPSEIPAEPTMDFEPPTAEIPLDGGDKRRRRTGRYVWANFGVVLITLVVSGAIVVRAQQMVGERMSQRVDPVPRVPDNIVIEGVWEGPWDGRSPGVQMRLRGSDPTLSGTVTLFLGGSTRESRVRGAFDRITGILELSEDLDHPGSGTYEATLGEDGALRGRFLAKDGDDPIPFLLVRTE